MNGHHVAYRAVMRYRITARAYFHLPVLVPFLLAAGLSVPGVLLLLAAYCAVVAFAGGPVMRVFGSLRPTHVLALGEAGKAAGLGVLLCGSHPMILLLGQVINGLGFCMTIGVDAALAGTLRGQTDARKDESAVQMRMFLCSFTAGVAGALMYAMDHRTPFMASIVVSAGCAVALLLVDADTVSRSAPPPSTARASSEVVSRDVRGWQVYYAVSRAVLLVAFTGLVPVLLTADCRIEVQYIGVALGIYTIGGLFAARSVPRLTEPVVAIATAVPLMAGLLLLPLGLPGVVIALALLGVANGFVRPATLSELLRLTSPSALVARTAEMERAQAGMQLALFGVFIVLLTSGADYLVLCLTLIAIGGATQIFGSCARRRVAPVLIPVSSRDRESDTFR